MSPLKAKMYMKECYCYILILLIFSTDVLHSVLYRFIGLITLSMGNKSEFVLYMHKKKFKA